MMLTTGECAELLNIWANAPGGYTADFVRGEIDDRRLVARIGGPDHVPTGTRRRRRVRVHPSDLVAYVEAHHVLLIEKARVHFTQAA